MPTKYKGVYASTTGPFDDDEAVFILNRTFWKYGSFGDGASADLKDRYSAIWSLVDEKGQITPKGAEDLRRKYQAEISTKPPKNEIIHLQWKKENSADGWQWNVPDDGSRKNNPPAPRGPVTRP